jgi:hypothetical protein
VLDLRWSVLLIWRPILYTCMMTTNVGQVYYLRGDWRNTTTDATDAMRLDFTRPSTLLSPCSRLFARACLYA